MNASPSRLSTRRRLAAGLRFLPILALAAASTPLPAVAAEPTPFRVSSCATCEQKGSPAVGANPQGLFFTAWTGAAGGLSSGVPARFFLANGAPRGADLLLSSAPAFGSGDVAVAAERSGFFVAAWSAKAGQNSEIFVQRFRRTLDPLAAATQVSVDDAAALRLDFAPSVAFLPDGTFMVVWARFGPAFGTSGGSRPEVMSRRYVFRTGKPLGPPQVISSGLVLASRPALCATRAGALAAVWNSVDGFFPFQQNKKGVVMQRLTPGGQPLGSPITVAAPATETDGVALACGGPAFTVLWRTDRAPASSLAVAAQRFSATGLPQGDAFVVSLPGATRISPPAASEDPLGNVIAAWSEGGAVESRLVSRRIEHGTAALGDATTVASLPFSSSALSAPGIAHFGRSGSYVVVWNAAGDGLLGRRFASNGAPLSARATAADPDSIVEDDEP